MQAENINFMGFAICFMLRVIKEICKGKSVPYRPGMAQRVPGS